jgi:hypothetical protein
MDETRLKTFGGGRGAKSTMGFRNFMKARKDSFDPVLNLYEYTPISATLIVYSFYLPLLHSVAQRTVLRQKYWRGICPLCTPPPPNAANAYWRVAEGAAGRD